jgi:hypothetical protein
MSKFSSSGLFKHLHKLSFGIADSRFKIQLERFDTNACRRCLSPNVEQSATLQLRHVTFFLAVLVRYLSAVSSVQFSCRYLHLFNLTNFRWGLSLFNEIQKSSPVSEF